MKKSFQRMRRMDLQAKIFLVLVGVILPTFLIVTITENQITHPILEEEIKQIGITAGKTLAAEIDSQRLLQLANPTPAIESRIQDLLYSQPNILRMDVFVKDGATDRVKSVASNVEEEPGSAVILNSLSETVTSEYKIDDTGMSTYEIRIPIEHRGRDLKAPKKLLGNVFVIVSLKLVNRIVGTLWKITVAAASLSVVILILVLSYFLRKTIANDRLLRIAESQNLELTEQLHEAQRQLMNTEKLAVMGQLTASFAHEIGTPLNAIGGHLQLLKEDIPTEPVVLERLDIIQGQLSKIEQIVKGFLQSTAKPSSQRQLIDLNRIVDQTLGIVGPRTEALGVEVVRHLDRSMGPFRAVPVEIEQILLNLFNNSLDSIKAKRQIKGTSRAILEVHTQVENTKGKEWAIVTVYDTGGGIKKDDLINVLKPFFTTKRPGEGTGLGLTICQELARKYGGVLEVESKEGSWTKVLVKMPYQVSA